MDTIQLPMSDDSLDTNAYLARTVEKARNYFNVDPGAFVYDQLGLCLSYFTDKMEKLEAELAQVKNGNGIPK